MGLGVSLFQLGVGFAVAAGAITLARGTSALVRRVWRAGYDPHRRLALVVSLLRFVLVLGAAGYVLQVVTPLLEHASLPSALLVGGGFLAAAFPTLQNILAGLYLIARNDIREGDRIKLQGMTGMVRELGLARVRVRKDDGTAALVPNRLLIQQPIEVQRASGRARIVTVLDDRTYGGDDVPRARELAFLCPYRVPSSPVHAQLKAGSLQIEIQAWRPRCHQEVESYLQAGLSSEAPSQPEQI
jgi:small-conductance mechanosensitive channel